MIVAKLLFVGLLSAAFVGIQSQENEGAADVENLIWTCTPDFGYDEDYDYYGNKNEICVYSVTPAPPVISDDELFPNFSCHPGFSKRKLMRMHNACARNSPECMKFCMIHDQEEALGVLEVDWNNYFGGNRVSMGNGDPRFVFRDSVWHINVMVGDGADAMVQKIKEDCQPIWDRVFIEEKHNCSSTEAEELYDCVNKAIVCTEIRDVDACSSTVTGFRRYDWYSC